MSHANISVKIVETGKHFLKAEVVSEGDIQEIPSSYSNPNNLVSEPSEMCYVYLGLVLSYKYILYKIPGII